MVFRIAGGLMFDSEAVACPSLGSKTLGISYDATRSDGNRLVLEVHGSGYSVPGVYDYQLRPVADFVADGRPVLVNLLGEYPGQKPDCEMPLGLFVITLHPAFLNTRLGWPLVRADMLPSSLESEIQWHTGNLTPDTTHVLARELRKASFQDLDEYMEASGSPEEKNITTNINDDNSTPEFCLDNGVVNFRGLPSVVYPAQRGDNAYNLPNSTRAIAGKTAALRPIDPEAYDTMINVYRVGALFRYFKKKSPGSWQRFIRTLPPKVVEETPRVACPVCEPEEVQAWLDECVASTPPAGRGRRRGRRR